jgi:hypothetical protein
MPAPITDLLVLQHELAELLRQRLAHLRPAVHILTPADLAAEEAEGKDKAPGKAHPVPAVNVVYLGHKFSASQERQRRDGRATLIAQLIALEVVTRNVSSLKTGSAARSDGGALALAVFKAAVGEQLPSAASPLAFVPGPGPSYRGGMQYLPLVVQADLLITK